MPSLLQQKQLCLKPPIIPPFTCLVFASIRRTYTRQSFTMTHKDQPSRGNRSPLKGWGNGEAGVRKTWGPVGGVSAARTHLHRGPPKNTQTHAPTPHFVFVIIVQSVVWEEAVPFTGTILQLRLKAVLIFIVVESWSQSSSVGLRLGVVLSHWPVCGRTTSSWEMCAPGSWSTPDWHLRGAQRRRRPDGQDKGSGFRLWHTYCCWRVKKGWEKGMKREERKKRHGKGEV